MIFQSEKEMQAWAEKEISYNRGLLESIENAELIKKYTPKNTAEQKIKDSFCLCINSLEGLVTLSADQNISLESKEVIRPDIIAYSIESNSLVLMELKNLKGPTRQAGTELLAYAAELKGYLNHLSDGDIINVIISTEWPTLLRHYIFNTIVWQHKNLICLEPFKDESGDIYLKCLDIPSISLESIPEKFSFKHLEGFHVCLYDNFLAGRHSSESAIHKKVGTIRLSMEVIATESEKDHSHGFAILCQNNNLSNAPYVITIVNANGLTSIERYFRDLKDEANQNLPLIGEMLNKVNRLYCNTGFSTTGLKAYNKSKKILQQISSPKIEGPNNWLHLQAFTNSPAVDIIHIELWGIFKEKFYELVEEALEDEGFEHDTDVITKQCIIDSITYEDY